MAASAATATPATAAAAATTNTIDSTAVNNSECDKQRHR